MAESSAVSEIYVPETTLGVTPVDDAGWKTYPLSGAGGIGATPNKIESTRVRGDRGKSAPSVVGFEIAGQYAPAEFKADAFDDIMESALSSTFGANTAGQLEDGSTLKTFSFERRFGDLTDKYLKYRGAAVNTMDFVFANVDENVTIAADLVAISHVNDEATSSVGAGSIQPETTNRTMTVLDLSNLSLGGTTGFCIESGSIQTNNNIRAKKCAGSFDAVDLLLGTFNLTGGLTLHTTDNSWALLANRDESTAIPLSFDLSDGTTTYSFNIPSVHVEFPDPTGEAADTSVLLDITIDASKTDGANTIEIVKS